MIFKHVFFYVLLTYNVKSAVIRNQCPKFCICDVLDDYRRIVCRNISTGSVDFGIPQEVEVLDLSQNNISELKNGIFATLHVPDLRLLNVSHNNISSIDIHSFKGLDNLKSLDISYNAINYLLEHWFFNLRSLQELFLRGNVLSEINKHPIINLPNLKLLDISDNKIKHLHPIVFSFLPNLETLDIQDNHLKNLDHEVLKPLQNLNFLVIRGNNLNCTQLSEVTKYITEKNIAYIGPCRIDEDVIKDKTTSTNTTTTEAEIDENEVKEIQISTKKSTQEEKNTSVTLIASLETNITEDGDLLKLIFKEIEKYEPSVSNKSDLDNNPNYSELSSAENDIDPCKHDEGIINDETSSTNIKTTTKAEIIENYFGEIQLFTKKSTEEEKNTSDTLEEFLETNITEDGGLLKLLFKDIEKYDQSVSNKSDLDIGGNNLNCSELSSVENYIGPCKPDEGIIKDETSSTNITTTSESEIVKNKSEEIQVSTTNSKLEERNTSVTLEPNLETNLTEDGDLLKVIFEENRKYDLSVSNKSDENNTNKPTGDSKLVINDNITDYPELKLEISDGNSRMKRQAPPPPTQVNPANGGSTNDTNPIFNKLFDTLPTKFIGSSSTALIILAAFAGTISGMVIGARGKHKALIRKLGRIMRIFNNIRIKFFPFIPDFCSGLALAKKDKKNKKNRRNKNKEGAQDDEQDEDDDEDDEDNEQNKKNKNADDAASQTEKEAEDDDEEDSNRKQKQKQQIRERNNRDSNLDDTEDEESPLLRNNDEDEEDENDQIIQKQPKRPIDDADECEEDNKQKKSNKITNSDNEDVVSDSKNPDNEEVSKKNYTSVNAELKIADSDHESDRNNKRHKGVGKRQKRDIPVEDEIESESDEGLVMKPHLNVKKKEKDRKEKGKREKNKKKQRKKGKLDRNTDDNESEEE